MADIRHALPSMPEPDKSILQFLMDYYENMKALEKDAHRGGKQATCIVMAMSDIKKIFEPKEEKTSFDFENSKSCFHCKHCDMCVFRMRLHLEFVPILRNGIRHQTIDDTYKIFARDCQHFEQLAIENT